VQILVGLPPLGRPPSFELLREFTDKSGTQWRVWDINPAPRRPSNPGKRPSLKVPSGWLAFEGGGVRKRLSPIPPQWEQCDDATLESLCASAEVVPRILRDIDTRDLR
jgi:hypothetical protein